MMEGAHEIRSDSLSPQLQPMSFSSGISILSSTLDNSKCINTPNEKKRGGRPPKKKFRGNQYVISQKLCKEAGDVPSRSTRAKCSFSFPQSGYASRYSAPKKAQLRPVEYCLEEKVYEKKMHKPHGNRMLDIAIMSEVFSTFRCTDCKRPLVLYEEDWQHGWQTFFHVKCSGCHKEHASFPSSRPLDIPNHHTCVNVPVSPRAMNEVGMRSVMVVHSTGMSWSDMHKIATIFDMPPPLENMPSRYVDRLEYVARNAVAVSMDEAATELHYRVDSESSPETNATNVSISFDSSWKTRGHYSNVGFGSAISTSTKKVLDYELLSRNCEKCATWSQEKQEKNPSEYEKWFEDHKPICNRNYTGSSQGMEPEAAKRIWGRSLEKHDLVYSVMVADGDSKSFHTVTELNPYPLVKVRKEECLTHVAKRLKRNLKSVKTSTKTASYVQHRLPEWKADYIASNYSTVVLQLKGSSPSALSSGLLRLLDHASGNHSHCPSGETSWCRWSRPPSTSTPPAALTTFTPLDIKKVEEVFSTYATPDFCSHITLGLTQNANESLHNCIWNLCPKTKYISPQSIRISTAMAIVKFNEGELPIYGLMQDLGLAPSFNVFHSTIKRIQKLKLGLKIKTTGNPQALRRKRKLLRQQRESALLKSEGGSSYCGGRFGLEEKQAKQTKKLKKKEPFGTTVVPSLGKRGNTGTKRKVEDGEDSSSSDEEDSSSPGCSSSSEESDIMCSLCLRREPTGDTSSEDEKDAAEWVRCDSCSDWFHCSCADVDHETVSAAPFSCVKCLF